MHLVIWRFEKERLFAMPIIEIPLKDAPSVVIYMFESDTLLLWTIKTSAAAFCVTVSMAGLLPYPEPIILIGFEITVFVVYVPGAT